MKRIIIALLFLTACYHRASAQVDPHFSQYYVYPSFINPALTGAFDGDYRISAIHRNQWQGVSNAFSTFGVSADMVTNKTINLGLSLMRQTAGSGGYTYTTGYLSIAYTGIRFDAAGYKRLVFGAQGGLISRRFDASKFETGSQWTPGGGFDPAIGSGETFNDLSSNSFDLGFGGLYYDANPANKVNIFAGASGNHLTQPEDKFTSGTVKSKLPIRLTGHAGAKINLSETFSLTPNALFMTQGSAQEIMLGAYGQLKATESVDLLLGANYRFNDALVPFAGFYYKKFVLGLSYDINNSDLKKSVSNANSFEISLSYIFRKAAKDADPQHFVCPRL